MKCLVDEETKKIAFWSWQTGSINIAAVVVEVISTFSAVVIWPSDKIFRAPSWPQLNNNENKPGVVDQFILLKQLSASCH